MSFNSISQNFYIKKLVGSFHFLITNLITLSLQLNKISEVKCFPDFLHSSTFDKQNFPMNFILFNLYFI